jgi:NADH-quinone oxidoreductase subunit M
MRRSSERCAVISIIYGACLALVQTDIKKIIAYSSISHLGYVMLGLVSLDLLGIQGAIAQMVSHGLVAGGLFLMVGMIYERCHTARPRGLRGHCQAAAGLCGVHDRSHAGGHRIADDQRLHRRVSRTARVLPCRVAAAREGSSYPLILASTAVLGVVLGALYMLWFAQRFLFGSAKAPHMPLSDLNGREKSILVAIVVAVFAFRLFPDEPLGKTELAARQYRQLMAQERIGVKTVRRPTDVTAKVADARDATPALPSGSTR